MVSPPVLLEASLFPESAVSTKLFSTSASFDWKVLLVVWESRLALLVESAPFPVFARFTEPVPQLEIQPAAKSKTISPTWSSSTLNSATAMPDALVFKLLTIVPVVLASPVVKFVLPPVFLEA